VIPALLTDTQIRNCKTGEKPVKLTDAGGLYIEVRPRGSKLWRYRYRIAGKENVFALGVYAKEPSGETAIEKRVRIAHGRLTLQEARTERDKCRGMVKQGIHPAHNRQALLVAQVAENQNTFEAVAREWIEKHLSKWAPYYLRQVERFLGADVYPYIGSLPMRSITAAHLLAIVRRVEKRGAPSVAILLRQWCSAIFRYAVSTLRADTDPAAALKGAVQRPKVTHSRPLTRKDIPEFVKALENYGGYRTTIIALRLALLTFVRTVELRAAEWKEIDLDAGEWRIPAGRMKMRELHIVPLSTQAIQLLRELHTLTGGQRLLFPNLRRPKACMTATTLNRALERMGYSGRFSAHGFRATASTILNELGYRPDLIERQLAHAERNKVRASYNRAEYLTERKKMMQVWADLTDNMAKPGSKIVPGRFGQVA
jgi:integrase